MLVYLEVFVLDRKTTSPPTRPSHQTTEAHGDVFLPGLQPVTAKPQLDIKKPGDCSSEIDQRS